MLTSAKRSKETRYRENKQQNQKHSKHYKGIWIRNVPLKLKEKHASQEIKRCEVIMQGDSVLTMGQWDNVLYVFILRPTRSGPV